MTITITEMVLFAWAILATASAIHSRERVRALMIVVNGMIKDEAFFSRVKREYADLSKERA